jgi:hypothetical protein
MDIAFLSSCDATKLTTRKSASSVDITDENLINSSQKMASVGFSLRDVIGMIAKNREDVN